jgi:cell division protein FtsX
MDVITFYATFIIVIGNAVRGIISGEAEKIVLTEMPEPKKSRNSRRCLR